ncbi:hypothetical protein DL771_007757 [Monosporascus sp. 5C6A]|nr:hypothetical protein DL771_007757 [Monosporascus sp. 5C6A]
MESQLAGYVRKIETLNNDVKMFELAQKATNSGLDAILNLGWCIISTWIQPELIVTADVHLPELESVLLNFDLDEPGSVVGMMPSTTNELWKLRAIVMIGYGPFSDGRPGLCKPTKPPDTKIAGLDIDASTHARGGGMPLPHDQIIGITILNGCWELDFGEGRRPVLVKARSSRHAAHLAWAALDKLGYDFVNIHNAFNFDLKPMAACIAELEQISRLFEEKRLGNFGSGVFMKLMRGCMFVDSMYTAMKTPRPGQWSSFGLSYMATWLNLLQKLDVDGMMIEVRDDYDMTEMVTYNCRDSDPYAWDAKELTTCEKLMMFASVHKS